MSLTVAMLWPRFDCNVGLMARSCEAFAADLVTTGRHTHATNTPKFVPYRIDPHDGDRWLRQALDRFDRVIALETGGDDLAAFEPSHFESTLLVLGDERSGVPQWLLDDDRCLVASIPMLGRCPSLNVAVAGSIAAGWLSGATRGKRMLTDDLPITEVAR